MKLPYSCQRKKVKTAEGANELYTEGREETGSRGGSWLWFSLPLRGTVGGRLLSSPSRMHTTMAVSLQETHGEGELKTCKSTWHPEHTQQAANLISIYTLRHTGRCPQLHTTGAKLSI